MLRKNLCVVVSVLLTLIIFNSVGLGDDYYSPTPLLGSWEECRRDWCVKASDSLIGSQRISHCYCYYAPALPDAKDKIEYSSKYEASKKVNLSCGYDGEIMLDGKRVENPLIKIKNFDFKLLSGRFTASIDDFNTCLVECSFYGAVLKGSTLYGLILDCDFRYANLEDVDFSYCRFRSTDKFKGAIILGARLPDSVTREMLLSTDSFTKKEYVKIPVRYAVNYNKSDVSLLKGEIPRHIVAVEPNSFCRKQQVVLDRCVFDGHDGQPDFNNLDFNKFNNGEKAPYPCSMQKTVFFASNLTNCKFTEGDLENAKFINCNLQGSDFSDANIRKAEFCDSDISYCNFENADIQGADFTGFYKRQKEMPIASISKLFKPDAGQKITKIQVEQLKRTKNFKRRELLDVKFGFTSLRGLDLSRFNLTGCQFLGDLTGVNFTDAVISKCDFGSYSKITISQIKSTWNYKTNQMNGITLHDWRIQRTLEAEK